MHISYSTPCTRFLTFFYHSSTPFTLQTFQKSLQPVPRFLNLSSYPSHLILQLFHAPTPPSSQFPPHIQHPHPLIPPPHSLRDPFDSLLNLPLLPHRTRTRHPLTIYTTHVLHSLHHHLCHLAPAPFPFPSTFLSLSCFHFMLHLLFLNYQPLTLGTLLSFFTSVLHLLRSTFNLMHTAYPTTPFHLSSKHLSSSYVSLPLSPKTHLTHAMSQSPDVSTCPSSCI